MLWIKQKKSFGFFYVFYYIGMINVIAPAENYLKKTNREL